MQRPTWKPERESLYRQLDEILAEKAKAENAYLHHNVSSGVTGGEAAQAVRVAHQKYLDFMVEHGIDIWEYRSWRKREHIRVSSVQEAIDLIKQR